MKKIGIIGYGSMGKMLLCKFSESGMLSKEHLFVANRTVEKIPEEAERYTICASNKDLAVMSDIVFLCVRPGDIKTVLDEIAECVKDESLIVSLNGSIPFAFLENRKKHKYAKVIPGVTAEINRSQTLITYNQSVTEQDRNDLEMLLSFIGNTIVLPEEEMGMGSELVSCMPGFIASMFDVICTSAQKHTSIPSKQIKEMVLSTLTATGELMLEKKMDFEEVVERVATKGGITAVGADIIYEKFPQVSDEMFEKTLEKRRMTAQAAQRAFED
jgi:pyrroline-5-carboxylate reductase